MCLPTSCAAAAALLVGSPLMTGCAKSLPASPVPAPLSDLQAMSLAEDYLDLLEPETERIVAYVEPTAEGDGHFVSFHTRFDPLATPPIGARLVEVGHDGRVREIRFRKDE